MIVPAKASKPSRILDSSGRPYNFGGGGGYDAGRDSSRRGSVSTRLTSEDAKTTPTERKRMVGSTRGQRRNFAPVAWAVRKHLDFIATFNFQAMTDDEGFNRDLEAFIEYNSTADRFDTAGRFDRQAFTRLVESSRTIDGDVFPMKRNDGTTQIIEADRVAIPAGSKLPNGMKAAEFVHGVKTDLRGRIIRVAVSDRAGNGLKFRGAFPGRFFYHVGYFDRYDQVRGNSPLVSAINSFQDVSENFSLSLAKAKIASYFGLILKRSSDTKIDDDGGDDDADEMYPQVAFDDGPIQLELDPGDDAAMLHSGAAAAELADFTRTGIQIALKSLDIPYSFFSEDFTNFYGSRGAVNQYLSSCKPKRDSLKAWLNAWTVWRIAVGMRDGDFGRAGQRRIGDMKWDYCPSAVPFWDPVKETRGLGMQAAMGLDNLEAQAKEFGRGDVYENIRANGRVLKYAKEQGVPVVLPDASAFAEITTPGVDSDA